MLDRIFVCKNMNFKKIKKQKYCRKKFNFFQTKLIDVVFFRNGDNRNFVHNLFVCGCSSFLSRQL